MARTSEKTLAEQKNEAATKLVGILSRLVNVAKKCGKLAANDQERNSLADFLDSQSALARAALRQVTINSSGVNPFKFTNGK